MKKTTAILILVSVFGISAMARFIKIWTKEEMEKASDLVVIGTVAKVQDLNETNTTLWRGYKFPGVEATFAVSKVIKGDVTNSTIVLHYYRFDRVTPVNSPSFLNLAPTDTNRYLLYLVKDGRGRYAPVSGQLDPSVDAVKPFDGK